jgi:hypothetical protein
VYIMMLPLSNSSRMKCSFVIRLGLVGVFVFLMSVFLIVHTYYNEPKLTSIQSINRYFSSTNHVILYRDVTNHSNATLYKDDSFRKFYHQTSAVRSLSLTTTNNVQTKTGETHTTTTVFYAIGDQPYKPAHFPKMKQYVSSLPSNDGTFLIHVGDIRNSKGTSKHCTQSEFSSVSTVLQSSPIPVFIIRKLCIDYIVNNSFNFRHPETM